MDHHCSIGLNPPSTRNGGIYMLPEAPPDFRHKINGAGANSCLLSDSFSSLSHFLILALTLPHPLTITYFAPHTCILCSIRHLLPFYLWLFLQLL